MRKSRFHATLRFGILLLLSSVGMAAWPQTDIPATHTECWEEQPPATILAETDSVAILRQRLGLLAQEADAAPFVTGIYVFDLTADSLLFDHLGQKVLRPASCQKILTAVTALDVLGRDFPLTTRAYCNGEVKKDTIWDEQGDSIGRISAFLQGDITIKGAFDPAFSYGDLKSLAASIKEMGIDSIAGQLRADLSCYHGERLGKGWCWDDVPSDEVPYLTPLLFNHELPLSGGTDFVEHPDQYFIDVLEQELHRLGVRTNPTATLSGAARHAGAGSEVFALSRTVAQLLGRMMKRSDNLYAEALFARLGGASRVEALAKRLGYDGQAVSAADGSGLSLYNYASPAAVVAFLRHAARQPEQLSALYFSLPVAGTDGTLSNRMKQGKAYRNIHAKTGTVTGVSSLSGYATAANGHLLAFSIISNGTLRAAQARQLQDRICQALTE